jgi:hypothetical protein
MSVARESIIITELREIKKLERRLQRIWRHLAPMRRTVQQSFVASLRELDLRAQRLEWMLLDPLPPLELKKAA